jgi:hypothetical protein
MRNSGEPPKNRPRHSKNQISPLAEGAGKKTAAESNALGCSGSPGASAFCEKKMGSRPV